MTSITRLEGGSLKDSLPTSSKVSMQNHTSLLIECSIPRPVSSLWEHCLKLRKTSNTLHGVLKVLWGADRNTWQNLRIAEKKTRHGAGLGSRGPFNHSTTKRMSMSKFPSMRTSILRRFICNIALKTMVWTGKRETKTVKLGGSGNPRLILHQ